MRLHLKEVNWIKYLATGHSVWNLFLVGNCCAHTRNKCSPQIAVQVVYQVFKWASKTSKSLKSSSSSCVNTFQDIPECWILYHLNWELFKYLLPS